MPLFWPLTTSRVRGVGDDAATQAHDFTSACWASELVERMLWRIDDELSLRGRWYWSAASLVMWLLEFDLLSSANSVLLLQRLRWKSQHVTFPSTEYQIPSSSRSSSIKYQVPSSSCRSSIRYQVVVSVVVTVVVAVGVAVGVVVGVVLVGVGVGVGVVVGVVLLRVAVGVGVVVGVVLVAVGVGVVLVVIVSCIDYWRGWR